MSEPIPVLQIIHVSDLHIGDGDSDQARLAREARMWRLWLRKTIEKRDWFGWHEGTLDHDDTAATKFEAFLETLRSRDRTWFPVDKGVAKPETWLIDTGDATTFGDERSMVAARKRLERWRRALGDCPVRWLFGNHDAWPGTQPGVVVGPGYEAASELQKNLVGEWPPWQRHRWTEPLVAVGPAGLRIECYGLNTVRFEWWDNLRAVGRVDATELEALCTAIGKRPEAPTYRILATHHPLVFPYEAREESMWFVQKMVLAQSGRVIDRLKNATGAKAWLRPYVHLMLAGHTHLGMPGEKLPDNVKEVYQGELGKSQLQLVAGALMLVRDRKAVADSIGPQIVPKNRPDFARPLVFDANQQFQLLRFWYDAARPGGLDLERLVIARVPNDPGGYRPYGRLTSRTFVNLSSP